MRGRYTYPKHLSGEWDFKSNASPKINMASILTALKSRTVWTVVLIFVVNGFAGLHAYIPADLYAWISGGLSLLAVYFKLNPSQKY